MLRICMKCNGILTPFSGVIYRFLEGGKKAAFSRNIAVGAATYLYGGPWWGGGGRSPMSILRKVDVPCHLMSHVPCCL